MSGVLYFDLETQRHAEEVGGWDNAREMLISVAACTLKKTLVLDVRSKSEHIV